MMTTTNILDKTCDNVMFKTARKLFAVAQHRRVLTIEKKQESINRKKQQLTIITST